MNHETAEDVEIEGTNPMIITFSVNADDNGIHRRNVIKITPDGNVIMNLREVIKGDDLEYHLKIALNNKKFVK